MRHIFLPLDILHAPMETISYLELNFGHAQRWYIHHPAANDAERSIKSFCVGKHSWHIIDSVKVANASALLYSIAETTKTNSLKLYEYFCYLLSELVKYPRNEVLEEELKKLMPWNDNMIEICKLEHWSKHIQTWTLCKAVFHVLMMPIK